MGNYILALHAGHNSSACIGDERGILFAIQEERLNGEKNYWGFPKLAVESCLRAVSAKPSDVGLVAYGGEQVIARYHSRDDVLKAYRRQMTVAGKLRQRVAIPLVLAAAPRYGQSTLKKHLGEVGLGDVPLEHFDHHAAHAATAYYGLRRERKAPYLVLTCDGAGDNLCATVRVCKDGREEVIATTEWGNSLGAIYSWVTYAMGFVPLEHEYKLMGMAPYASSSMADEAANMFRSYLGLDASGMRLKRKTWRRANDLSDRVFSDMKGKRFDAICAGLQHFTEELLTEWTKAAVKKTGITHVVAAGGVFMNVKANKRIGELPEVESFEAFPSCGDETLPLGAYYLAASRRYGHEKVEPLSHFYFGDAPTDDEITRALAETSYKHERPANVAKAVVELLAAGHPVARCAGRMEFGARALGNRSILADPSNQDVVRVINQMVKKRDFWMPFAPMGREARHREHLVNPKNLRSPYMMMTFDTNEKYREIIAAVHNADLTSRAQVIPEGQNPEVEAILDAFEARTGRPVVLNTSFNLHGFPIVRTAKEALYVFANSGLEYLQLGDRLVSKG